MKAGIGPQRKGWIDDDIAFTTGWGFDVSRIGAPVLLMHGKEDRMVPRAHAEWLAENIDNCEFRRFEGEGHLSLLANRMEDAFLWLLSKC